MYPGLRSAPLDISVELALCMVLPVFYIGSEHHSMLYALYVDNNILQYLQENYLDAM